MIAPFKIKQIKQPFNMVNSFLEQNHIIMATTYALALQRFKKNKPWFKQVITRNIFDI